MNLKADYYANDPEIRGPALEETRRALEECSRVSNLQGPEAGMEDHFAQSRAVRTAADRLSGPGRYCK